MRSDAAKLMEAHAVRAGEIDDAPHHGHPGGRRGPLRAGRSLHEMSKGRHWHVQQRRAAGEVDPGVRPLLSGKKRGDLQTLVIPANAGTHCEG